MYVAKDTAVGVKPVTEDQEETRMWIEVDGG